MKNAILSYENKLLKLDGTDCQNIGDWIQLLAVEQLYREWGLNDYIWISRNTLNEYEGEGAKLLFNGWNSFAELKTYLVKQFPIPDSIKPIFFSFNLEGTYIPQDAKKQLKKNEPIGCRDEGTKKRLEKYGIECFVSGCISSLLPRRIEEKEKQTKVIIIDVSDELLKFVPDELKNGAEFRSNLYRINRIDGTNRMTNKESMDAYGMAKNQLQYLEQNAKLVITSRLHIASPCIAMGIPVVLAKESFDERFAWIEKYVPLYSRNQWGEIDWEPSPVDYECEKRRMKEIVKSIIWSGKVKRSEMEYFEKYYSNRQRAKYNYIIKNGFERLQSQLKPFCKYVLCGVALDTITLQNVIGEIFPEWELYKVFDSCINETRYFEGKIVEKMISINTDDKVVYLVATRKEQKNAIDILKKYNCKYVVVDYETDNWINNL